MSDASGATVYSHDARNRLSSKQTPFGTLSYTYNDSGSLLTTRSSNANGVSVDYNYDALNRLATARDNNLVALNGGVTTYSCHTVGNLQSYLYPNGVTTSYNYNSLNRLTSMNASAPVATLASYTYTLGAAGNRTAVTELSGRTVNYTYDDLYRLTSESIANDPHAINGSVSYGYDATGNRLNRSSSVAGVPSQSSTYDANDRLTSDSYDNNGNTLSANSNTYAYDFENHLTSLNGGSVGYVYDGDGNRVAKTIGGITTNYLVDTNNHTGYAQVVDELQSGSVIKSFTYGHDLISQRIVGSTLSFYGYDGHGSVRLLTDATASVTDTYDYDAFGNLISRTGTTPNDYLFSGEQFDAHLGFYYLRARYMNPSSGRFWTQDSFEGRRFDPRSLHKYLYANSDPVNRIDPSGYASSGELLAVAGIISVLSAISLNVFTTLTSLHNIEAAGGLTKFDGYLISGRGNFGVLGLTGGGGIDIFVSKTGEKYYSFEYEAGINPATLTPDTKSRVLSGSVGLVWGLGGDVQRLAGNGVSAAFPVRALPLLRSLVNPQFFSEVANFATYLTAAGNRAGLLDPSITFGVSSSGPAFMQIGVRSTALSSLISNNTEYRPISELPSDLRDAFTSLAMPLSNAGSDPQAAAQAMAQTLAER